MMNNASKIPESGEVPVPDVRMIAGKQANFRQYVTVKNITSNTNPILLKNKLNYERVKLEG